MSNFETLCQLSPTISVGILSANLMSLASELSLLEQAGAGLVHVDVMDGHFTPTVTIGPPFIKALQTPLLKDVHLMIKEPLEKLDGYVAAGADVITVHVESSSQIHATLQKLNQMNHPVDASRGLVRGVALNPGTSLALLEPLLDEVDLIMLLAINPSWKGSFLPSTFSRISAVKDMISKRNQPILIAVDGGIQQDHVIDLADAGVDIVVTGSAVFDGNDPVKNARSMLNLLQAQRA